MECNVIMPMLGQGSRMAGVQPTCKPLMKLPTGETFFLKALSSLTHFDIKTIFLVVLEEHFFEFLPLTSRVHFLTKCRCVRYVPHGPTASPVESFRLAFERLWELNAVRNLPLIVLDCDIYSEIPKMKRERGEWGHLFWFADSNPNKCYIETTEDKNRVIEIVEKQPISEKAVFGAYLFENIRGLRKILCQEGEKFQYMSDIFKAALPDAKIGCTQLSNVSSFGTLEELQKLLKNGQ